MIGPSGSSGPDQPPGRLTGLPRTNPLIGNWMISWMTLGLRGLGLHRSGPNDHQWPAGVDRVIGRQGLRRQPQPSQALEGGFRKGGHSMAFYVHN
jgi:hypothetical protein